MRPVGDVAAAPASIRAAGDIPARIPGCAHTDLMRAGLISDPRIGTNEVELLWIGETDWEYRSTFEITPEQLAHDRLDLACDGLDTIAELFLNGQPIGSAANAFHPHRFDLRSAARLGTNELSITFRSPMKHIRAEQSRLGALAHNGDGLGWHPYNFIRKAACNFGWDWAPNVATCGIFRATRIEAWNRVRIVGVATHTRHDGNGWLLDVTTSLEWVAGHPDDSLAVVSSIECDGRGTELGSELRCGMASCVQTLGPLLVREWFPREHGEQLRYQLRIAIAESNGGTTCTEAMARSRRRAAGEKQPESSLRSEECTTHFVAFRRARLNTELDQNGSKFQLEINGIPIFCKGANWIPEGLFPDDRADEVIRERVRQAAAANMNMLRVWGGGAYECDAFYDECDKQGIMVWQDFMFACACYPEEAPFPQLVEQEARHQIARLSSHPSVVLWCGGNECVWGYESWGYAASDVAGPWKKRVGDRGWGGGYYFDLLPRLMRELDPTRPYWANSPFAGRIGENPNQETRGDRHTWDATFLPGAAGTDYRTIVPRFCAEFGHQSPSNMETLARVLRPEELSLNSPALEHHQKGTGGTAQHINKVMATQGSIPTNFAEWHRRAQELQAETMTNGIEHHAAYRESGRCMGVLIWQFNDAWPGMSWSIIDSDGKPKPAYEAVKRAFGKIP